MARSQESDWCKWKTYISRFFFFFCSTSVLVSFLWSRAPYSPSCSSVCGWWLPPLLLPNLKSRLDQKGRFKGVIVQNLRQREHKLINEERQEHIRKTFCLFYLLKGIYDRRSLLFAKQEFT